MMIRRAATLIASFAFGVLITLVLQDIVTPHAVAQTMPLKEKPPPIPPPGKPSPPPPPIHLQPLKLQPWQQYVKDQLQLRAREDEKQDAQLSQLNSQVSSLNSQVSNLTSALNKLQTRFVNHYHTYYVAGSDPIAIETPIACHGMGNPCVGTTSYDGGLTIPVISTTSKGSPGGNVPTSVSVDGPPPQPPVNGRKLPPHFTH